MIHRRRHEGDLGGVLTSGGLAQLLDQSHAQCAVGAQCLEAREGLAVCIDRFLQLGALIVEIAGINEDGRDAGIDQSRLDPPASDHRFRHFQRIDHIACGEHAALASGGVAEGDRHFGGREGHAIQGEVAAFLDAPLAHRHPRNDGLGDVGLPDTHLGDAITRQALGRHQALLDGEGPDRRREIAAVAAPIDEGRVDGDLAEQIVDVVVRLFAATDDHRLAGAGGRAPHAVDLLGVGVGAADHAQQQGITRRARHLRRFRQLIAQEEHALAGAATQIGGGNPELCLLAHADTSAAGSPGACEFRKSSAKRCSTPPAE